MITLLEAEARVIEVMKQREPDKVLDPDIVRFVAETLVAALNQRGDEAVA